MSRAYQGAWFDPVHTLSLAREWLFGIRMFRWPVLRMVPRLLWIPTELFILLVLFRGFRRPAALPGLRRRFAPMMRFASKLYGGRRSGGGEANL
jgi:hypothetical protein